MALSNELSSEIAAAILVARDKSPLELVNLKEIVVRVHMTLQEMTDEARRDSHRSKLLTNGPKSQNM
jgi:hypothetical protein